MALTQREFDKQFGELISRIQKKATPFPSDTTEKRIARIERAKRDKFFFAAVYFPHYIELKPEYRDVSKRPGDDIDWLDAGFAPIHAEFFEISELMMKFSVLAAFRESAKDTLLGKIDVLHKLLCEGVPTTRWFIPAISITHDKATGKIIPIKLELESNLRLQTDFGDQRGNVKWEQDHFILKNGRGMKAYGREESLRGEEIFGHRPDHILLNDINDPTKPDNPATIQKFTDSIKEDILMAVNSPRWSALFLCNYTVKGDIVDAVMTGKHTEHFNKKIYRALVPNPLETKEDRAIARACREAGFDASMKSAWEFSHPTLRLLKEQHEDPETFNTERMMRPRNRKDQKFKDNYFRYHTREELAQRSYVNYTFVDPSAKESADYKAVITVGLAAREDGMLHIPVRRAWIQQDGIDSMIAETYRQKKAFSSKVVGVETNGFQILLKPEYLRQQKREQTPLPFQEVDHKGESKESRVERLVPYVKEGIITFDLDDPDQELLIKQLKAFPTAGQVAQGGLGDDGADALEGCVEMIEKFPHYGETEYQSIGKRTMRFKKEGAF